MKIILFGASKFVIPLIEMLKNHYSLALVVTTERDPLDTLPAYCQKHAIPYLSIKTLSEALERIEQTQPDLGILAYFGLILPQKLLQLFPHGILNIHPSLLPHYRGATPVQTALLNGDQKTGVSIIKLDEQMDHGPILAQAHETISSTDTTASLHEKLFTKGTEMLQKIISAYLDNKITAQKQNDEQATYTKRSFTKQDGYIDTSNPPDLMQLDRMIRAYYPWPTVWTKLKIKNQESRIKLLPEKRIQVESRKPMTIKDFINGYPEVQNEITKLFDPLDV